MMHLLKVSECLFAGVLTSEAKLVDILDKGKGAVVIIDGKCSSHWPRV